MSDQIALNYVVCIYFASPGASHLHNTTTNTFFKSVVRSILTLIRSLSLYIGGTGLR